VTTPEVQLGETAVAEVTAAALPVAAVVAEAPAQATVAVPTPRPPAVAVEGWQTPAVAANVVAPLPGLASFAVVAAPGALVTAAMPCVAEVDLGCIPGPPGTPGPPGPAGGSYEHHQGVAADTWMVVHDLGFNPNVTVVDSAGEIVEGEISYLDGVSLVLSFSGAFVGAAYLS